MFNCPVCGQLMEPGDIHLSAYLKWSREPKSTAWGEVTITPPRGPFINREHIPKKSIAKGVIRNLEAHICKDCKKLIIDYE